MEPLRPPPDSFFRVAAIAVQGLLNRSPRGSAKEREDRILAPNVMRRRPYLNVHIEVGEKDKTRGWTSYTLMDVNYNNVEKRRRLAVEIVAVITQPSAPEIWRGPIPLREAEKIAALHYTSPFPVSRVSDEAIAFAKKIIQRSMDDFDPDREAGVLGGYVRGY